MTTERTDDRMAVLRARVAELIGQSGVSGPIREVEQSRSQGVGIAARRRADDAEVRDRHRHIKDHQQENLNRPPAAGYAKAGAAQEKEAAGATKETKTAARSEMEAVLVKKPDLRDQALQAAKQLAAARKEPAAEKPAKAPARAAERPRQERDR